MLSLSYWICILRLALSATKPRSIKNISIFWFYNLPNCLRLYMLYNRYITSFSLIALKDFILGSNFIKIGRLLSVSRLLRYALIISNWSTNNHNRQKIARSIYNDFLLTVRKKVLLKSIPCIYEKPYTTSLALY